MSDEEDDRTALSEEELKRIEQKIKELPTLEKLLQEKDPHERTEEQLKEVAKFVEAILDSHPTTEEEVAKSIRLLQKKWKKVFHKSLMLAGFRYLQKQEATNGTTRRPSASYEVRDLEDTPVPPSSTLSAAATGEGDVVPVATSEARSLASHVLQSYLVSKAPRSQSGVLVVTVFTSAFPDGAKFSCAWNCYYCPNEPGQPRSYLLNEPGVRRANRLGFDAVRQFSERVESLHEIGHPVDKVELLVLGGTWESYPMGYRERFIRDLFYAANTFSHRRAGAERERLSLLQEQLLNESAKCRIIGVTLETRPDTINEAMLVELRRFGCTRVQLGVQHTDDGILIGVNRQATREDTIRAIKLLKDNCFKVDIHLMPDLPGSTPDADIAMIDDVLYSEDLQADQWKLYPCQTTPFTVIEQWYRQGIYRPYGLQNLIRVLLHAKSRVHPWIRLNRVIRDIPVEYILAGIDVTNLRQLMASKLKECGTRCQCIRCREVKGDKDIAQRVQSAVLVERSYKASKGEEYFLSFEAEPEDRLLGFLRLRMHMRDVESPFPELEGCALIRELHVYGLLVPTHGASGPNPQAQHTGIGSRLLNRAEALAVEQGYKWIAVISGVGVRGYYKKRGYELHCAQRGGFLIKRLGECIERPIGGSSRRDDCLFLPYKECSLTKVVPPSDGEDSSSTSVGVSWLRRVWNRLHRKRSHSDDAR